MSWWLNQIQVGELRRAGIKPAQRTAFTLVELMLVISVITLVASATMFALYGALQQAKEDRTRTQIAKLHTIIMAQWETYATRRVSIPPNVPAANVPRARLFALRQLMRMELPDRITDLNSVSFGNFNLSGAPPARTRAYLRMIQQNADNGLAWSPAYQSAECLYMIIATTIDEDGENAIDSFPNSEIDDVDGDGMKEILDAWGNPIKFIRWPAGFVRHVGPDLEANTADDQPSPSSIQDWDPLAPQKSPDTFDPNQADLRWQIVGEQTRVPFALFPLIYSGGKDEVYGMGEDRSDGAFSYGVFTFDYFINTVSNGVPNPYAKLEAQDLINDEPDEDVRPIWPGTPKDFALALEGKNPLFEHSDNITNHSLEVR